MTGPDERGPDRPVGEQAASVQALGDGTAVKVGSLCSGYEGIGLGLASVFPDIQHSWFVEYNPAPSKILAHHWPDVPNYGDVKLTDWAAVEPVDILTAGYPCQPFSHAGLRKGADDPRHLWPGVARAISVLRPGVVLLENVRGHVSLGLDAVLGELAALGYDATWGVVRAADAGAPHSRARIFIVATDTEAGSGPHVARRDDAGRALVCACAGTGRGADAGDLAAGVRLLGRGAGMAGSPAADTHGKRHERCGAARGRGRGPADDRRSDAADGHPALRVVEGGNERDDEGAGSASRAEGSPGGGRGVAWGAYAPAIQQWEAVTGRAAPRPTEPGRTGERLSPRFVEWMMGLPAGHVTDVPGLARNAQLKALGNGVVPQQAALAVRTLLPLAVAA